MKSTRGTCSIHGEKEQILVTLSFFSALLAWTMASQGAGMSRKTASAAFSKSKPLDRTSRCLAVTQLSIPCSLNSSRAVGRIRSGVRSGHIRSGVKFDQVWLSEQMPLALFQLEMMQMSWSLITTPLIARNIFKMLEHQEKHTIFTVASKFSNFRQVPFHIHISQFLYHRMCRSTFEKSLLVEIEGVKMSRGRYGANNGVTQRRTSGPALHDHRAGLQL